MMIDDVSVAQGPDVCDICLQPIRRGDLIYTINRIDGTSALVAHQDCDPTTEETA